MSHLRLSRRAFLAGGASLSASPALAAPRPADREGAGPRAVNVVARTFSHFDLGDRDLRRFGKLHFLSGLELRAPDPGFGGFSALRMRDARGGFLALNDNAVWIEGRIASAPDGRMTGIEEARLAPLIAPDGKELRLTRWYDTEGLALLGDGTAFVCTERASAIWRFDLARQGLGARAMPVPIPAGLARIRGNRAMEALDAFPPKARMPGALLALIERGPGKDGWNTGFIVGGPSPGTLRINRTDDYDISDCAFLPSGDLLILERAFSWAGGLRIRLRHVPLEALRPQASLEPPTIFEAGMHQEIDNFEGLSAHLDPQGRTILTLISDDNFNWFQRTLLVQFRLDL